jgi:hypothetical protein
MSWSGHVDAQPNISGVWCWREPDQSGGAGLRSANSLEWDGWVCCCCCCCCCVHSVRVVAWPHDRTVAGWVERGISKASSWQSMVTRISSVIACSRWMTRKFVAVGRGGQSGPTRERAQQVCETLTPFASAAGLGVSSADLGTLGFTGRRKGNLLFFISISFFRGFDHSSFSFPPPATRQAVRR